MPLRSPDCPLSEPQRTLAAKNFYFVRYVVSRYFGGLRGDALDEAVAAGALGLIRAAQLFDPSLGYRFTTLASPWIFRAVQAHLARDRRQGFRGILAPPTVVSLDAPAGADDFTFAEMLAAEDPDPAIQLDAPIAFAALDRLTRRERAATVGRVLRGEKLREIGKRLGISRQRARQLQTAGLEKLRAMVPELAE